MRAAARPAAKAALLLVDFKLWIPADCVAAETPALKTRALAHLARVAKAATAASSTPAARVLAGLARIDL